MYSPYNLDMNTRQERPRKQSELIVNDKLTDPESPEIQRMSKIYKFLGEESPDKPDINDTEIAREDEEADTPDVDDD